MRGLFVLLILQAFMLGKVGAQPGFPLDAKTAVHRFGNPYGGYATGTAFIENGHWFLLTAGHAIKDGSGSVHDSVQLALNSRGLHGETISGPKRRTVLLRKDSVTYYYLPECPNVDLALISLEYENFPLDSVADSMRVLLGRFIPNPKELEEFLAHNGTVTVIGYPQRGKLSGGRLSFPEYRWGTYKGRTDKYLEIDVPILPGSSGSPAFMRTPQGYAFIGVMTAGVKEHALAVPSSLIRQCFSEYFRLIQVIDKAVDSITTDR